ncbi:MAG TPA: DUF2934 domain-containing protein [Vicinamibacterales bacterium]|jgi:hypothetical protein|nr:DUF2934 domain-containing protein [Vicinamibacterales bacterium]
MARKSSVATVSPAADFPIAIAERAYFKAERRGFSPGHELEDWLAAEREVSALRSMQPKPKRLAAPRKNGVASKAKPRKTK